MEPEKAENGFWLYGRLASKSAVETITDSEIMPNSQIEERAEEATRSVPFTDNQAEAPNQDKSPVVSSPPFQDETDPVRFRATHISRSEVGHYQP